MSKLISIFFLSLYMMVSSGLMVNLHFCGDTIAELAIFFDADGCCPPDKEAEEMGCCSNESIYVVFDEDQLQHQFEFKKLDIASELKSSFLVHFSAKLNDEEVPVNTANAPPLLNRKIYLQLSRLKVFGDC